MVQEDEENLENNVIDDPEDGVQNVLSNDLSDHDIDQGARTNNQFDELIATRTAVELDQLVNNTHLTLDQEEQIRKNKEKAEQLRKDRLQRQARKPLIQLNAAAAANLSQDLFPDDTVELDMFEKSQTSENTNHNVSWEQEILPSQQSEPLSEPSQESVNIAGHPNYECGIFNES